MFSHRGTGYALRNLELTDSNAERVEILSTMIFPPEQGRCPNAGTHVQLSTAAIRPPSGIDSRPDEMLNDEVWAD